ncbi:MAG: hypothetical protein QOJ15_10352 [Bradyrhizobium sp.]|jgi:hypothetical protein|nr:hypothetical protein [Bradyrhizobium sp.]
MAQSTLLLRPAIQDQLGCRSQQGGGIGSNHARSRWVRNPPTIMSDSRHNWNRGLDRQAIPVLGEAGSISGPLRDRNYRAGMTQLWFSKPWIRIFRTDRDRPPCGLTSCEPDHVTFCAFCTMLAFLTGRFKMRKILLAAVMALACGAAHAQGGTVQTAQATSTPEAPAQAAPAQAAPAPQAAAPEAATPPAAQPSRPAKKRQARRRETDEAKARRIAAKYGVSW